MAALAGAAATCAGYTYLIFQQRSSTAALGLLALPFLGAAALIAFAAVGLALFFATGRRVVGAAGVTIQAVSAVALAIPAWYAAQTGLHFARFREARNPSTPAHRLEQMTVAGLRSKDYLVLSAIAANQSTPAATLLRMVKSPDPGLHDKRQGMINLFDRDSLAVVRKAIRNANLPAEAIPILAASPNDYVLSDVAAHARTPAPLVRDIYTRRPGNYLIQWGVVWNPNAPPEILEELAKRKDDSVVLRGLAGNPSTPAAILADLAKHEEDLVRSRVAANSATPETTQLELAADKNRTVRYHLATNRHLSEAAARKLLHDSDPAIVAWAERRLRKPPTVAQ